MIIHPSPPPTPVLAKVADVAETLRMLKVGGMFFEMDKNGNLFLRGSKGRGPPPEIEFLLQVHQREITHLLTCPRCGRLERDH